MHDDTCGFGSGGAMVVIDGARVVTITMALAYAGSATYGYFGVARCRGTPRRSDDPTAEPKRSVPDYGSDAPPQP